MTELETGETIYRDLGRGHLLTQIRCEVEPPGWEMRHRKDGAVCGAIKIADNPDISREVALDCCCHCRLELPLKYYGDPEFDEEAEKENQPLS